MELSVQRTAKDLQPVLYSPDDDVEKIVYWVYHNISDKADKANMTIIAPGTINSEYHKTYGHYHTTSTKIETYTLVSGEGFLALQKPTIHSEKELEEFLLVSLGKPGDSIDILPEYGHSLINVGNTPLITMDNWTHGHSEHDYAPLTEQHGLCFYVLSGEKTPSFSPNPSYEKHPDVRILTLEEYTKMSV